MNLRSRLALRVVIVLPCIAALLFVPAGSFLFWQGWTFLSLFVIFNICFLAYFYRRDPKLLERRLQNKEQHREQKVFKALLVPSWLSLLALPGLDFRFG
jgi:hypothetical protein